MLGTRFAGSRRSRAATCSRCCSAADLPAAARVPRTTCSMRDELVGYIVDVVRATRTHESVLVGAGPRATQALLLASARPRRHRRPRFRHARRRPRHGRPGAGASPHPAARIRNRRDHGAAKWSRKSSARWRCRGDVPRLASSAIVACCSPLWRLVAVPGAHPRLCGLDRSGCWLNRGILATAIFDALSSRDALTNARRHGSPNS